MRIGIYAIAKNEAKHVERFITAASDADHILIADTGSTDDTIDIARALEADVYSISVNPWRFDYARNTALALLPADIDVCISVDMDEIMLPGWRQAVEAAWTPGTTRLQYRFDNGGGQVYNCLKAHARHGYTWRFPIHEYVGPIDPAAERIAVTGHVLTRHDPDKSKSRGQYMTLLDAAVAETPDCARMSFYRGRELYYMGRWREAVAEFERYLALPNATWNIERGYAMRIMGRCYVRLDNGREAQKWLRRACAELPTHREPWVDLADACQTWGLWVECFHAAAQAVNIQTPTHDFTGDPDAWGAKPHDLLALAAYHLNLKDWAIVEGQKALDLDPENPRLAQNMKFYRPIAAH